MNIKSADATSKASARSWRLIKLGAAIKYREAGKFPISDYELDAVIKELIDVLALEK